MTSDSGSLSGSVTLGKLDQVSKIQGNETYNEDTRGATSKLRELLDCQLRTIDLPIQVSPQILERASDIFWLCLIFLLTTIVIIFSGLVTPISPVKSER